MGINIGAKMGLNPTKGGDTLSEKLGGFREKG